MSRPIVALTMGDAAGIGPEIIVRSLLRPEVYAYCRPCVIGDAEYLWAACSHFGIELEVCTIDDPGAGRYRVGTIDCLHVPGLPSNLVPGTMSAAAGEGAYRFLATASRLAIDGVVQAICTAPLNKAALHAAGHHFPGHTELLAHLTGTPEVSMMLVAERLRVIHVTTHIGLLDAIARIEPGLVFRTIERAVHAVTESGISAPRIGVCGINPHAGEGGLFGHGEEEEKILPAVRDALERGWQVEGPLPADTLFFRAARGDFDVVVAMYHDQGHGPVKVLGIDTGVNVTVGLPVIRTSVDHGTAFDIAWTGRADERSLLTALRAAADLSAARG